MLTGPLLAVFFLAAAGTVANKRAVAVQEGYDAAGKLREPQKNPEETAKLVDKAKAGQSDLVKEINSFGPILNEFCQMEVEAYPKRSKKEKLLAHVDVLRSWKQLCQDPNFLPPMLASS